MEKPLEAQAGLAAARGAALDVNAELAIAIDNAGTRSQRRENAAGRRENAAAERIVTNKPMPAPAFRDVRR